MKTHFDEASALLLLVRHTDNAAALRHLLEKCGNASDALSIGKDQWRAAGFSEKTCQALISPDLVDLERDLEWCDEPNHHLIGWHSPDYPCLLRQSDNPPAALFVAGDMNLLWHPQIAVVGSRNPSAGGKDTAHQFARAFAQAGWSVTSGMAQGIDTSAHAGAMEAVGEPPVGGLTIAVVATGLDRVYPEQNRDLMQAIVRSGAVVSEHPPGTPPLTPHFPSRNRIIAGLSLACLVVEAAERSGALITARLTGEMGREVFAIPGSIHNPMARGCHKLIRQGATLVDNSLELIAEMQPVAFELAGALRTRLAHANPAVADDLQRTKIEAAFKPLWDAIGHDLVNVDQLVLRTGLTTPELSSMLMAMELDGCVTVSDGRYARIP